MVASSMLLALLSTLVAASSAKDYLCGANSQLKANGLTKKSQRAGSWNYGVPTNPLESPWLVQLVYADKTRACAGSLITNRHVLTARQCVDGVKPEHISVVYGPRTPYGGNASVKSAKSPSDANVDLAVLELSISVEISDNTIPVCVGDTSDVKDYPDYKGLHFGPKNKSEDGELARSMYQDVLLRADEKECIDALGKDYHKDTQFCVGKRNMVFAEGISTGGPILIWHPSSGRLLQVGIALRADAEHNYGSATNVTQYQKEIGELTGCYLTGAGLDSKVDKDKQGCDDKPQSTTTQPVPTTSESVGGGYKPPPNATNSTYPDAERACFGLRGTLPYVKGDKIPGGLLDAIKSAFGSVIDVWLFKGESRDKDNLEDDIDKFCYALSAEDQSIKERECSAVLHAICDIPKEGTCKQDNELYFDGHCYKVLGDEDFDTQQAEAECQKDGGHLAVAHSDAENHHLRNVVKAKYEAAGKGPACVRLGVTFDADDEGKSHSVKKVLDGTAFDFGLDKDGKLPACKSSPGYPWCKGEPNCKPTPWGPETSLTMITQFHEDAKTMGRYCWNDETENENRRKCSALCKRRNV